MVTLDRVRRSAQKTVIEQAGTTLENETVLGDLVIAESVGEGNVTLKNVTVLGSVIVKGGGANSVYFDGVRVGGAVRLEKEGVHLRLRGDTALERVEIGLPCRITRDSTFEGALGALAIDLAKESAKEIQIEVPAKRVELLSRANVALNADVETLRIDRDAESAQLDIKRGAVVKADFVKKGFFADVPADSFYYEAVKWAVEKGITNGTDAMHFDPAATCTRADRHVPLPALREGVGAHEDTYII